MNCEQCGGVIGVRTLPRYEEDGLVGIPGVVVNNAARETYCEECGTKYGISVPDVRGLMVAVAMARIHLPVAFSAMERRFLRRAIEWPAKALAQKLGVSTFTLSRWENDDTIVLNPAREILLRLHIGTILWEDHGWKAGAFRERDIINIKLPTVAAAGATQERPVMEFDRVLVQVETERHESWHPHLKVAVGM